MKPMCIWCEVPPAGGFFIDDLCAKCEKEFFEESAQDPSCVEEELSV